jgi:hypothetical protein
VRADARLDPPSGLPKDGFGRRSGRDNSGPSSLPSEQSAPKLDFKRYSATTRLILNIKSQSN